MNLGELYKIVQATWDVISEHAEMSHHKQFPTQHGCLRGQPRKSRDRVTELAIVSQITDHKSTHYITCSSFLETAQVKFMFLGIDAE